MKKKKILFLTPYPFDVAPSQRLKFEQYYDTFESNGFEVHKSAFIDHRLWKIIYKKGNLLKKALYMAAAYFRRIGDLFRLHRYDVVYVHLWVTPLGPPFFEWMVRKLSLKLVYDIDDLVFMSYEKGLLKLIKGKNKPIYLMKHADHVITCTPYLDEFVRKLNPHTTDISSTINSDTYVPVNTYSNDHVPVLGWSGSHSTSRYLYLLKEVLLELYREQPFKLLVIGDKTFHIEGLDIEATDWSRDKEIPYLQRIDIGLYPLPLDDKWVLGKSGLKALQYMMLGIPTVATAIGANYRVIEDGVSGYLVTAPAEWKEKLSLLIRDEATRKRIGLSARRKAENEFSINATKKVYLSILNEISTDKGLKV